MNALAWIIIALVVLDGIAVYACSKIASDVDDWYAKSLKPGGGE